MRTRNRLLMLRTLVVVALLAATASGCLEPSQPSEPEVVRFVVFGDWGAEPTKISALADAIWIYCYTAGCDLALGLGDNFYERGVTGIDDPQWSEKFQVPFEAWEIPLYMTLGNHDHAGSVQAQIDYSDVDARWRMPAAYYDFTESPVQFIAVDTVTLGDDAQIRWLGETVRASDTPWRVIFGHYPWRSHGGHGNATNALRAVWEWTLCERADLLLAGHEHDMQLLEPECGVSLATVASGVRQRPVSFVPGSSLFANSNPGFLWVEATEATMLGKFIDLDGVELFNFALSARKHKDRCESDGTCNQACASDEDCFGLVCTNDAVCESRCTDDPDCFSDCECDQRFALCEAYDDTSSARCGCDPACRGEAEACVEDGACDARCPASVDPDC